MAKGKKSAGRTRRLKIGSPRKAVPEEPLEKVTNAPPVLRPISKADQNPVLSAWHKFWQFSANILSPIVVAVFTGLLYLVSVAQWDLLDGQLQEMKKATEQVNSSIEIAKEQTRIASEASKTAKDTLISSQRAWIGPSRPLFEGSFSSNNLIAVVAYQNLGREPAQKVKYFAQVYGLSADAMSYPKELCKLAAQATENENIVFPGDGTTYYQSRTSIKLDETSAKVFFGKAIPTFWGCFDYETFGERHQTEFCFQWIPKAGVKVSDWEWRFCPSRNRAN